MPFADDNLLLDIVIAASALLTIILLFSARLRQLPLWRAAVTPLASIIGSGFLVLAPILLASYGRDAPLVMAALCIGAWIFGAAIRSNIRARADGPNDDPAIALFETMASWALIFAFMISVAYYLNLLGAFSISLTPISGQAPARVMTSAAYMLILIAGWRHGFSALEKMEYSAVAIKLTVIAGLLAALALYCWQNPSLREIWMAEPKLEGWHAITLAFGLLITVQGFETSRYLGEEYDADTRIRSMRLAQLVSMAIYMIYIILFAIAFANADFRLTETAIIGMMAKVSPILPVMLVAAAITAQFSAAIADTSGGGGLTQEMTRGLISARAGYALLTLVGLALTWFADIFTIILYASRAFAGYYALQSAIAARYAWLAPGKRPQAVAFAMLSLFGIAIMLAGEDVKA